MGKYFSKEKNKTTKPCINSHEVFSRSYESKDEYNEGEHYVHIATRDIFKVNFSSDIQNVLLNPNTKILDVGCGFGFWLTEMASDFPRPSYFGIDILPIYPKSTFPNNITFQQHDILKRLPFEDNSFDFIHIQFLNFDITELQWETIVFQELARILKPGGWLEFCEMEYGILNYGPLSKQFDLTMINYLRTRNVNPQIILRSHSILKSIPSFSSSHIHHKRRKFPIGSYKNQLEELCAKNTKHQVKSLLKGQIESTFKSINGY
ncbi:unnamed protein product [Rhizophagus irregularis]|nr:unnamed protein product [Rhizophagus irregularis]CAB5365044.1 unnamed protein product [Rhizophagus irregularis]